MIMVIDYSFVNQFWKQCWLLDYQRVKLFGKRFCEKFLATQCFEKLFLVLILIKFSLDSWILILIVLESWFLKLDWILRLDYSWILILWNLILEAFWLLILWNLLNSWFFGIIKIILEDIASTLFGNSRCWNVLLCLFNHMWAHEWDERMNGESMML